MKQALAVIVGVIVGFISIMLLELLGHALFPIPEGIDPMDMESLKANMDKIPAASLVAVAVAHFVGLIAAVFAAKKVLPSSNTPAYIVIGLFALATIANLVMIPHPMWFALLDVVAIAAGAYLGLMLAKKYIPQPQEPSTAAPPSADDETKLEIDNIN